MAVTAVRSNAVPAGGPTAQQPVPPTVTPPDIAALAEMLTPAITKFRRSSFLQTAKLADQTLSVGQENSIQIANVGLGLYTLTEHTAVFNLANSGGGAQTATFGATFPFNLVTSIIAINGGATVYNADGYMSTLASTRAKRGALGNNRIDQTSRGLSPGLVRMSFGANLTGTAGNTLCGFASVSIALGTNGNLTVVWYTKEKLARDLDSMIGALPLQNNNTWATLDRTFISALTGTSGSVFPFSALGANVTITLTSYKAVTRYRYASIPGDPGLYQELIANSYQTLQQKLLTVAATGPGAIDYKIPQNNFLTALHFVFWDGNNNYLAQLTALSNYILQYNSGGVVPVQRAIGETLAEQLLDYEAYFGDLPGYVLWDGNNTADDMTAGDDMGWLNAYQAASPEVIFDLATGTVTPVTYNVTRESVVAGSVQTVGG